MGQIINEADISAASTILPPKGHPNYFATMIIHHNGFIYFYFHSMLLIFNSFSIWNVLICQLGPEVDFLFVALPPQKKKTKKKSIRAVRVIWQLSIKIPLTRSVFAKHCEQTPVFRWQLTFSQIGGKNGKSDNIKWPRPHLNIFKIRI